MTTGTVHNRNVSPWADLSTLREPLLTTVWLRAGLELDLLGEASSWWEEEQFDAWLYWLLVRSATEASALDRWCIIE